MDWLNIVLGSSAIIGAIAAIWQWLTNTYLPAIRASKEKSQEHTWKQQTDQQEFLQATQSDALKAVLDNERTLMDHLIGLSNGQFASISAEVALIRKNYRADMDLLRAELSTEVSNLRKELAIKAEEVKSELRPQLRTLTDIKTQMSVVNRDWARFNEIVGDIDLILHRIEVTLKIQVDEQD